MLWKKYQTIKSKTKFLKKLKKHKQCSKTFSQKNLNEK